MALRLLGRPPGITLLTSLLAINGVASLLQAFGFVQWLGPRSMLSPILIALGVPSALASVMVGLLLLRNAHRIWELRHEAWLKSLLLVSLKAVYSLLGLVAAPLSVEAWIHLALPVVTVLYLAQPRVRALYSGDSAP